jgi:hypothetical protein
MKLALTPTATIQMIDGIECRVWEGADEYGTPVKVWIRMVSPQTHDENRLALFDAALAALPEPQMAAIDMRFVS